MIYDNTVALLIEMSESGTFNSSVICHSGITTWTYSTLISRWYNR